MEIAKPIFYFCHSSGYKWDIVSMIPAFVVALVILKRNKWFGLCVGYLAIGSTLMHIVDSPVTRIFDGSAMLLIASYLTFRNLTHLVLFNLVANLFLFIYPPVSLILFIATIIYLLPKLKLDIVTKALFLLGFLFWILDITKLYCNGHAIWHVLSALGIYFLLKRSKKLKLKF
ncbi:MAG TPA: hypothetical protein VJ227_02735 [Patescibacteria group bacterium]|nr:hypothetical protein [Patescibacteria group bacterium]